MRFYRLGSEVTQTKDLQKAPKRSHVKLIHLHTNSFPFGSFSMLVVVRRHYETLWHSFGDFPQSSGLVIAQDSIAQVVLATIVTPGTTWP